MVEMIRFLDNLESTDRFWPWLRTIAMNKIRHHYRQKRERSGKVMSIYRDKYEGSYKDNEDGFANLVSEELKQIVTTTMYDLKARHRQVLVLRCYEELGYSEIADEMGCSEFGARMLFLRAKKSLARRLSRRGLGKGSMMTALVVFGKLTAPSEAAAAELSITAATLKVGAAAGVTGAVLSKTAVLTVATAGALSVGTMMVAPKLEQLPQAGFEKAAIDYPADIRVLQKRARGEERWYFYPEGPDNAVMMRAVTHKSQRKSSYCQWLQDEQSNYYYDSSDGTIYINNYRMWNSDLSVRRLPTDSLELREFLSKVEGKSEEMDYVSYGGDGLLVVTRTDEEGVISSEALRHHKVLDEEYFRYNWSGDARIVDKRDEMHRRGWTYFKISGELDGQRVTGSGQIPFAYAAVKEHECWLRMKVGNNLKILDNGIESYLYGAGGKLTGRYKGGSFFKGLGRPWIGLHTIDIVRRDAAEKQMLFETKYGPQDGQAQVSVYDEKIKLVYTIDLERDVIERITVLVDEQERGELRFSYLDRIIHTGGAFSEPARHGQGRGRTEIPGMPWLVQLAEGVLGE
jgi:RNA polymerase sigma factor (sigma-70 family)